jgi:hypothetical protein
MAGHVNIHFRCTVLDCECGEAIVAAQVVTRADGTIMYEYTNRCPRCAHKLSAHKMTEQPVTPRRLR